jgi:hypothetical protein
MDMAAPLTPLSRSPFEPILGAVAVELPVGLREQYLVCADAPYEVVLTGHMARVWHRPAWLWPIFWALSRGDVLFPETGVNVPTTVVVAASRTCDGTPSATWLRTFFFPGCARHFISVVQYDNATGHVIEVAGLYRAFRIEARVCFIAPATIEWTTVTIHLRVGHTWVRVPRRLSIMAHIVQRADAEQLDTSHVMLTIRHGLLGPIFGCEGTFRAARRARRGTPREGQEVL